MTIQFLITVMPFGVSEQAFQGVTPSFHLSNNQFFETVSFRSSFQSSFLSAPRLTFSVRNVSHLPLYLRPGSSSRWRRRIPYLGRERTPFCPRRMRRSSGSGCRTFTKPTPSPFPAAALPSAHEKRPLRDCRPKLHARGPTPAEHGEGKNIIACPLPKIKNRRERT